jgi:hypothetical protein
MNGYEKYLQTRKKTSYANIDEAIKVVESTTTVGSKFRAKLGVVLLYYGSSLVYSSSALKEQVKE